MIGVDYHVSDGARSTAIYNLTFETFIRLCNVVPDKTFGMIVNAFMLDKIQKPSIPQEKTPTTTTHNEPSFDDILRLSMRMMDECRESREFIVKKEERDVAAKKEEKEAEMARRMEEKAEAAKKEEREMVMRMEEKETEMAMRMEEKAESARQHNEILSMLVRVLTPIAQVQTPTASIASQTVDMDVAPPSKPTVEATLPAPSAKLLHPSLYFRSKNVPQDPRMKLYNFMVAISKMHMTMRGYPTTWARCGNGSERPVYHESDLDVFDAAWAAYRGEVAAQPIIPAAPTKRGRMDAIRDPRQPDIRTKFPKLSSDHESVAPEILINII
jgi:hypothetical protein